MKQTVPKGLVLTALNNGPIQKKKRKERLNSYASLMPEFRADSAKPCFESHPRSYDHNNSEETSNKLIEKGDSERRFGFVLAQLKILVL